MSTMTRPVRSSALPSSARSATPKTAPCKQPPMRSATGWRRISSPEPDPLMVAVKAADVDAFVARPDPARPVVLVFGPDAGLVSERVNALIKASVDDVNDPFALARLEGEAIAAEPTRLVEEAQTMPLFGGRRAVWVKAGNRNIAPAVEAVLGAARRRMPRRHRGRRSAPQRAAARAVRARQERGGAAVLCRQRARPGAADRRRDARRRLDPDARSARAADPVARRRPRRLAQRDPQARALCFRPRPRWQQVGVEDVTAVVSDASALALEDIVDAAFAGRPAELEAQLAKARTAGTSAGSLAVRGAASRCAIAQMAAGDRGAFGFFARCGACRRGHFRRKTAIEAALRNWTAARLLSAMAELADATLESRRQSDLADTIAERALLAIATQGRRSAA